MMASEKWKQENQEKMREYRRKYYHENKEKEKARIQKRKDDLRKFVFSLRENKACIKCGENHPACLDFHHRDPSEKEAQLSNVAVEKGWSKERILDEVAKCDILCANCHRKHHYDERNKG